MNITQINNANTNFKGIHIAENKAAELFESADRHFLYSVNFKIFMEKIKIVDSFKNTDVYVQKDGTVYAKQGEKRIIIKNNEPLMYKFYLALTYAQYMEEHPNEDPLETFTEEPCRQKLFERLFKFRR